MFKEDSMADYFSPTVVQPTIPNSDMTALERLLLTHIFESEPDGDGLYFFAETSPNDQIELPIAELRAALASATRAIARATSLGTKASPKGWGLTNPIAPLRSSTCSRRRIVPTPCNGARAAARTPPVAPRLREPFRTLQLPAGRGRGGPGRIEPAGARESA
jgi:hypothetical protein